MGAYILVFSVHRGVVKDIAIEWTSILVTSLKFFVTLGLATMAQKEVLVAAVAARKYARPL